MEKLIEFAVDEYLNRVDDDPVIDSKIVGDIVQEFGFEGCRQLQSALDDRLHNMRVQALGK